MTTMIIIKILNDDGIRDGIRGVGGDNEKAFTIYNLQYETFTSSSKVICAAVSHSQS